MAEKYEWLTELNSLLNVDKRENEIVNGEPDESAMEDRSIAVQNNTTKQGGMKL